MGAKFSQDARPSEESAGDPGGTHLSKHRLLMSIEYHWTLGNPYNKEMKKGNVFLWCNSFLPHVGTENRLSELHPKNIYFSPLREDPVKEPRVAS